MERAFWSLHSKTVLMFLFGNCHLNVVETTKSWKNNATCAKKRIITYEVKKNGKILPVDWHKKEQSLYLCNWILWHENLFWELIAIVLVIEIKISLYYLVDSIYLKMPIIVIAFFHFESTFENVCCCVLALFLVNKIISERVSIIFLLIDLIVQFENI